MHRFPHRFPHRGRRPPRSAPALLVGSVVTFVLLGCGSGAAGAKAASVPYTDSAANGRITLCDPAGNALVHGDTHAAPFVWKAVTSTPGPPDYQVDGRTASLFGFQPRPQVPPGNWSGQALGAAARYNQPPHPTAQLTPIDPALDDFIGTYPPQVDRLVQLRMLLGAPNQPVITTSYASLDVRISADGNSWDAVDPGTTSCSAGSAASLEVKTGLAGASATATPASGAGTGSPSRTATGAPRSAAGSSARPVTTTGPGSAATDGATASSAGVTSGTGAAPASGPLPGAPAVGANSSASPPSAGSAASSTEGASAATSTSILQAGARSSHGGRTLLVLLVVLAAIGAATAMVVRFRGRPRT